MNKVWKFHIRETKGHRGVTFVIRRNSQPCFHLRDVVDRIYQEAVEATSEPLCVGHQGTIIEGH